MGKYFETDGFRGEANINLTVDHAFKVGRYIGYYYGRGHKARVVIGKDTRLSSYMFEYALAAGLMASGADVYLLHVTTTPSVAYITRIDEFDCGIMITASHNPYQDNGIKLINGKGEKMSDDVTDMVEQYIDGLLPEVPYATGDKIGKTVDYASGRNRYIGYLISLATQSYKGIKVGLDCANGSTWMIAKAVFDALGAQTYVINNEPNGTNVNVNAGSTHIDVLQKFVKEKGLDIGFAFDGDADRCLAVDENGNLVDGDAIMYLYGAYLKKRDKLITNTIVGTVMSNFGLGKALEKLDIDFMQTQVGDRFVYEAMRNGGHVLGGENSGHIIFSKYATTGDGMLTAIKVMQAMLEQKMTLSKLVEPLVFYPQVLKNVRVIDKEQALNNEKVQQAKREAEEMLNGDGRILLRKSGTEPVIRVMAECSQQELCNKCVDHIINALKAENLVK
ncbi:MAG: phosphoglucosamine mutase [Clostridia bacterium]|nr:phosphoglucosamine mutase [Clostridia bacterium]MBR6809416.1 phosphoglucosamine mutase [Clostridia bacterium]